MRHKSSSRINTQSWYFTDLQDSRLGITPPNADNVSTDPNNPNKIMVGGGNTEPNGDIVTLFEIFTNTPYNETKIPSEHIKYKSQKFIQSNTDWTNFEVTGYFTFMNTNHDSEISIYGRSGRHIIGRPCEGTYYRINMAADGRIRCDMKHWHPGGYEVLDANPQHQGDVEGMKVGFKYIVYTHKENETVIIEGLVDMNNSNLWERVCYVVDNGDTSDAFMRCGDESTKLITWGGPIIGIEVRNFPENGLAIEKLSVREIDALSSKVTVPVPAAVVDPEAVSPPVAPPSTGYRTDLTDTQDDDIYQLPEWGDPGDNPPPA